MTSSSSGRLEASVRNESIFGQTRRKIPAQPDRRKWFSPLPTRRTCWRPERHSQLVRQSFGGDRNSRPHPVIFHASQMLATSYRLFKRASDPLYRGLGPVFSSRFCACPGGKLLWRPVDLLEITGLLWILVAAAIRATQFTLASPELAPVEKGGLSAQDNTRLLYSQCRRTNPWQQPQTDSTLLRH